MAFGMAFFEPPHTIQAVQYWRHQWSRPYHLAGLFFGLGMLTWCLILKKTEKDLMTAGWLLTALAFGIAIYIPIVN